MPSEAQAAPSLKSILPERRLRQQLHVSGINMMNDCGQRFLYRYVLGVRRPPSAFLLVGKSTDESVTQDLNHKIDTGELLQRADVVEIASAKFDAEQKAEPIELDRDEKKEGKALDTVLGEAKDKTVALAGLHHDQAAPKIEAVQTRRRFSIDMDSFLRTRAKEMHTLADQTQEKYAARMLDDQARSLNAYARDGVDFVGEQDVVESFTPPGVEDGTKYLVIRDTKTSAKSPSKSYMDGSDKAGTADDSEQLTAYAVASHVVDGKLPDRMVLDYLVRTNAKTPGLYYVPTATTRSMDDVTVFLNRFANAIHAMKTGVYVPANQSWWGCAARWCGYYDICPYAKRPHTVPGSDLVNIEGVK